MIESVAILAALFAAVPVRPVKPLLPGPLPPCLAVAGAWSDGYRCMQDGAAFTFSSAKWQGVGRIKEGGQMTITFHADGKFCAVGTFRLIGDKLVGTVSHASEGAVVVDGVIHAPKFWYREYGRVGP